MSRHGKHVTQARTLRGIDDDTWELYGEHAESLGLTRTEWVRRTLAEVYAAACELEEATYGSDEPAERQLQFAEAERAYGL